MVNILKKVAIGLIADLPLSLLTKLSDGKLTTSEIIDISREVALVVTRVLAEEFGDDDTKEEILSNPKING